ncbi:class I SAM-dependent methyltransferase [Dyadobacter bucti]|uniref:class I SAM-dependent methyltransferase n=1 Tax=Dyadobacter bucti TaxID=2572203 RepID=UPI001108F6E1|nr:class I SAM-dependent methyltransferase [Dyadobacter bucti]
MINNRLEYQRMYDVERKLWWYQILHSKVLGHIRRHFKTDHSEIRILDAACGTGGLLSFLREKGYNHLTGFDYSAHAIDFSRERNLEVNFGDLKKVGEFRPGKVFDVICCNDALYFLTDEEIISALKSFKEKLNPNGILIVNIHAFEAFSGTHDLAVGSSRRFTLTDFRIYSAAADFKITYHTYWPFALSLPIFAIRQWQKFRIRNHNTDAQQPDSDVKFPGKPLNSLLLAVTKAEAALLPRAPFGSSLFMVFEKT